MTTINELYLHQYYALSNKKNLSEKEQRELILIRKVLNQPRTRYQPQKPKFAMLKRIQMFIDEVFYNEYQENY